MRLNGCSYSVGLTYSLSHLSFVWIRNFRVRLKGEGFADGLVEEQKGGGMLANKSIPAGIVRQIDCVY